MADDSVKNYEVLLNEVSELHNLAVALREENTMLLEQFRIAFDTLQKMATRHWPDPVAVKAIEKIRELAG